MSGDDSVWVTELQQVAALMNCPLRNGWGKCESVEGEAGFTGLSQSGPEVGGPKIRSQPEAAP
eukprot:2295397-Amphidinium_carterae.1